MEELELKLPKEVMDGLPSTKEDLVQYLSRYFDGVLTRYNERFQKRVGGFMGQPLSRYELAMLKDMLMDLTIGNIKQSK